MADSPLSVTRLPPPRRSLYLLAIFSALLAGVHFGFNETPPVLTTAPAGKSLVLSWPAGATNWQLCSSAALASGDTQIVPTPPTLQDGKSAVTLPMTGDHQFYQLRKQGAIVPFVTIEAEAASNSTDGTTVKMTESPKTGVITPELEASGRGYVELNATGQHLDFPAMAKANTLVIRNCIPDALAGGGTTATLSLYVNAVFRQKVSLTSKYNWLYGPVGKNGQSNDPTAGLPHVYWDEVRTFITGGLNDGDTLRLEKDADDTAEYYRIDLVDLEDVAAPLAPPAAGTYLSIADFGANGTDAADDTAAIQACIAEAKTAGKIVWMPAGTYYQAGQFILDGLTLRGAGMWYTNLISTIVGTQSAGNVGFVLKGSGSAVSDLSVESAVHTTRSTAGGKPFTCSFYCTNWSVTNVWITHTNVGFWMSAGMNGVIRGCRVRQTFADGINLNRGSSNNLVEMNHVRGSGDDGIAISSETNKTPDISINDTVRSNTVTATWWGHNCDVAGGSGHLVEDNLFVDNPIFGCFTINLPSAYPMYPMTGAMIRRNTIVRGGGMLGTQKRGAVWIYPGNQIISGVVFRDNLIKDPVFFGFHMVGTSAQDITFERNIIENPGLIGLYIESQATGSGYFDSNICRDVKPVNVTNFSNRSPNYVTTLIDNSWQ